jgi:hypothetical protein
MTRGVARRLVGTLAIAAISCIDLTVDPEAIGSIDFPALPSPSVAAGDTLRDSLGTPAPLHAIVYNTRGDEIPDAAPLFVARDMGISISSDGLLLAKATATGTARVSASIGSLQSLTRSVVVVPLPDTARAAGITRYTIDYAAPGTAGDTSAALQVAVRSATGVAVSSWVVRYRLFQRGQEIPATDTTKALFLVDNSRRPSRVDTTDGTGIVARWLRIKAVAGQVTTDSVEVVAEVRARRAPASGSPVSFMVLLRPRQ